LANLETDPQHYTRYYKNMSKKQMNNMKWKDMKDTKHMKTIKLKTI
jgi:hypothetical protein